LLPPTASVVSLAPQEDLIIFENAISVDKENMFFWADFAPDSEKMIASVRHWVVEPTTGPACREKNVKPRKALQKRDQLQLSRKTSH
jgi:hypothetical protein